MPSRELERVARVGLDPITWLTRNRPRRDRRSSQWSRSGIDPQKASHTAVALDAGGVMFGELRVAADRSTVGRLLR
jgi:hypothetical protein